MTKFLYTAAMVVMPLVTGGAAHAACGDITVAAFSWQSAEVNAYVDQFILNNGYGCNVSVVAGDTVPTITSMIERGQPDIAPALSPSAVGEVYVKGAAEGRISKIGTAISNGTVTGWYIPKYIADAHPDIKTIEDALKHPELFPAPENPSKGGIIQGPQGRGSTIVTGQLFKAFKADEKGFELVPSGSGAALEGAITRAYERKQGYIAYHWVPTSLLAKYPMVRLEGPEHDAEEWGRCTTKQDCPDPKPNYWKPAEEVTAASSRFLARDDVEPAKEYFAKRSWTQAEVGQVMLWMTENQANGQNGARWFIEHMPEVWTKWVPADVAEKVKAAL
ncbi:glycine betaine ABC transporter substrate-binding protein [Mesorhizobium wenxiniae]|uniref:ABC transporter substrate-binding protein n=1 Tax=Mesorhizobium wenxiniae TaxID=2014805 RepID=A0A271K899_9HYPH|nr:glycine betaine ABC transporter substrate-binding protein [Mesorhizobium wenxiniae]PAP91981.1 ABC transporter substrate-binding protein [Mesorhizobium wenxiniae]